MDISTGSTGTRQAIKAAGPGRARPDALVQAAFTMIAEHGFEGLALRQVAAEVGIDQSTVHHYFPTKQHLVDAVVVYATEEFRLAAVPVAGLPAPHRLRERLAQLARMVDERPELFVVLREMDLRARRDPAVAAILDERERGWRTALSGLLGELAPDPETATELIIAAVKGVSFNPPAARPVLALLADVLTAAETSDENAHQRIANLEAPMPDPASDPEPPSATFRTTIQAAGKSAAGIVVPPEVVDGLGHSRKPPVHVTIGKHTYRSTVAVRGGQYLIGVSAENRRRCEVSAGDEVEVTLRLDTLPRELVVPADLTAALEGDPAARQFFAGLSYSQRQWHVLSVEGAKTPETRQRRLQKSVDMLRAGRTR